MARPRTPTTTVVAALCLVLVAGLATVLAQRSTLQLSADVVADGNLVDNYGRTLYLNLEEGGGESSCYEECAANWPPLLVRNEPTVGEDLDASLVGTIERENGSTQLTYAGWPLYYFTGDAAVGDYRGQGVDDQWYMVSASGEPLTEVAAPEPPEAEAPAEPPAEPEAEAQPAGDEAEESEAEGESAALEGIEPEVFALGQQTYDSICAACHGRNGQGGEGVRLVGNPRLADGQHVANVVIRGFGYMPAIGAGFSDEQVAAVATYVRNSWGNEFGPVSVEEVTEVR